MRALILAAGLGSRLRHMTANVPKAMVEVDGIPIITRQIRSLQENGIEEVGVVLGYKSDVLENYLVSTHPGISFSFFFNPIYDSSNSAYSFYVASDFVKDYQYIHLNCDILFSSELLSQLIDSSISNIIASSFAMELSDNMEMVSVDINKKILVMDNILFDRADGKAFGLAKLSPESNYFILEKIKDYIALGDYNRNYFGIIRQAVKKLDYYCLDSGGHFLAEINTLTDFQRTLTRV